MDVMVDIFLCYLHYYRRSAQFPRNFGKAKPMNSGARFKGTAILNGASSDYARTKRDLEEQSMDF